MDSNYLPIEDYGAIGNLRSVALVGRNGSIDWWPTPMLSDPAVFAAILDDRRGGRFQVSMADGAPADQRYIPRTNVLETEFSGEAGRLTVTDGMALEGDIDGVGKSRAEPAIHRLLRADGGDVTVEVQWSPRFRYGGAPAQMAITDGGVMAWAGDDVLTLHGLSDGECQLHQDGDSRTLTARLTLADGEERALVASWWGEEPPRVPPPTREVLDEAIDSWQSWVGKADATGSRSWAAPYEELVVRAELALKLLTHADTGAIAAAATTSLPEDIGGVRNWDYRYCWIRDSSLAAQAMHALGHDADAHAFVEWAETVARAHREEHRTIQIVYGLDGATELTERELPQLEGYRGSAPVRVGNGAVDQLQLDVYGELISVVYEMVRFGDDVDDEILAFLPQVADEAALRWNDRDNGIWEPRNGPFHFVHSKVMVWMGLERAIKMARAGVIDGDAEAWEHAAGEIREEVLIRGFSTELDSFVQSYERAVLDASSLLIPLLEFLPFEDPRVQSTIDAVGEGLRDNGLIYRYLADDGIAGEEGAFGLCSFWFVDALAMSGRVDEAREAFAGMAARANHLGLYSEELDPRHGGFLGNFPQAFSHIGLINSAIYLAYAQGRDSPVPDPIGSKEHREAPPFPDRSR
ncbi:MAG TPA: glycoside hydrolase family 15 protein [Actinomycetaceae bacterium]|nr:glycoside hydrolase family 15 protein [Actinomycetaceae bacterium]